MPEKMTMRAWRRAKSITEGKMAEQLKVSVLTIRRWEAGAKMPVTAAIDFCDYLGIGIKDVNWNP